MRTTVKEISSLLTIAFLFAMLVGIPASIPKQAVADQVSRQVREDLSLTSDVIQVKRKAIVSLNLQLTDAESQAFWPVYDQYWAERKKLSDRTVSMISDYAKHYVYESMTNEKAGEMIREFLAIQKDRVKLKEKYVKKFKKAIPETKLLRYFQIENKLDLIIDSEVSAQIPLARES